MTPSAHRKLRWSTTDVARMLISSNALASTKTRDAVVLAQRMRLCRVASGSVFFKAGDTQSDFLAFVLEGEAVVQSTDVGAGEAVVFNVVTAGQMVGEMAVVSNVPRSASVIASSDMVLAVLDQSVFAKLIKEVPSVACGLLCTLLQSTSDRLRESNRKLLTLTKINQSLFDELEAARHNDSRLAEHFVSASNLGTVLPQSKPDEPPDATKTPAKPRDKQPPGFAQTRPM